jgi:ParB-like chromosome segregation protein Spo0J
MATQGIRLPVVDRAPPRTPDRVAETVMVWWELVGWRPWCAQPSPQNWGTVSEKDIQKVPIRLLQPADSPRLSGEDQEHIRVLAESDADFPPILVHRSSMRIIDGMHRLAAARLRGQDRVDVEFFDGTDEAAFVLAVQANIAHGRPLTFADREAAAVRIIGSHPHWSDRAISAVTGLGARTVASVRRRTGMADADSGSRVGRDGRTRPLNGAEGRRIASVLIQQRPDVSLRAVARAAGISPTTARDVRERLRRGDDPVPAGSQRVPGRRTDGGPTDRPVMRNTASVLQNLKADPSLRFTESGRWLLRWLFRHTVGPEEWLHYADAVPPHCAYTVAALARTWAAEWTEFARRVEQHTSADSPGT